jgi:hypothetical protein
MDTTRKLQFGDRLANGARVVLASARQRDGDGSVIVLAEFRADELVVWTVDPSTGDAFNGRYFAKDALNEAVRHLNERAGTTTPGE